MLDKQHCLSAKNLKFISKCRINLKCDSKRNVIQTKGFHKNAKKSLLNQE